MLDAIMFLSGTMVMVLEMVGARLLAPHLGTSVIVWTSLIGVVLASLSAGYWLGGRLADRTLSRRTLSRILAGAALSVLAVALA
ncbi:spermine synthase, partial [Desulfovibrio oxamicus]